ncbi:MAG: DUF2179 domain-containing protein [Candidatus Latescibacteria bacterium]|nr:DUF2179 domain-containing protein [Candidatus Latescibacterota bacterium]
MDFSTFLHSDIFKLFVLPIFIFLSRVTDVSIGTMRVIFVSKGYKHFAVLCGFFEVLIWLVAVSQVLNNLTNVFYYIAYAGGFATGNFVGMFIEEKIALGTVLLRVITKNELVELSRYLKDNKYGFTLHAAEGVYGSVKILFTIIPRTEITEVVTVIKKVNPQAFYTIEDIRFVNDQSRFIINSSSRRRHRILSRPLRKGK